LRGNENYLHKLKWDKINEYNKQKLTPWDVDGK